MSLSEYRLEVLWIEACMMLLLPLLAQSMQMSHDVLVVGTTYVSSEREFTWMDGVLAACKHMAERFSVIYMSTVYGARTKSLHLCAASQSLFVNLLA